MAVWAYFAAAVPAILLYVLLFMETHICELLMLDRTSVSPNPKGAGVHWDIVLLCGCNCLGAFFGSPWVCAATVRAVAHVSGKIFRLYMTSSFDDVIFEDFFLF